MTKVNMHEAKTHLSKLVDRALAGQDIVIAKAGKGKVRLVPIAPEDDGTDWFGMDEGKIWIADDFDELPEDLIAAFYGEEKNENPD